MISQELLQSFIAEASDLLDDMEPSLVEYPKLQDADERMEVVNRVFRHFHSIKGSAGFVGLHDIARLTHEAETLLEQFRKSSEKVIPQDCITVLCRTVDLLRVIFNNAGDEEKSDSTDADIDVLIGEISAAIRMVKGKGAESVRLLAAAPEKSVDDAEEAAAPAAKGKAPSATKPYSKPPTEGKKSKGSGKINPDTVSIEDTAKESVTRVKKPVNHDTARIIHTGIKPKRDKVTSSEFISRYVTEANELLEQIEHALLSAEQHPEAGNEFIPEALRCLHSFKGNSGFMNLADLERLSHRMEAEVESTIGRSMGIEAQTFDALLQMIDVLRQGVTDVSLGGSGAIPETEAYIAMLDDMSSKVKTTIRPTRKVGVSAPVETTQQIEAAPEPTPDPEPPATKPSTAGKSSDTTRLVLRGAGKQQENLADAPKADVINIGLPEPEKPPSSSTTVKVMGRPQAGDEAASKASSAPEPYAKEQAKPSDTSQKRRIGEQLASRNDIRVDLRKLDSMLDLVGELVIAEAMVTRHPVVWNAENESLERAVHQLRRVASSLQDMATSVRMIPLAPTFRRMTRLVYDLSVKAGKQIDLILLGEDTEVDRTVIERISDPLVHIIRNAIDHGIEPADERAALGKPATGRLTIEGHHEGGEVWIVITDDGRGLDKEAILKKAISRGMIIGDGSDLSDAQIYHFIFEPGFSTAQRVTDISGRGFGMDVVKKNIEKLSGKIDIRTRAGEGTAVVMRIPLTLAIIEGMLVRAGETRYIIPLLSIRESMRPEMSQILATPDGQELVKVRDELIPIVRLDETFSRVQSDRSLVDGILMIVEGEDGEVVAIFADELLGQQETVIKGLSGWLKKSRGVSGCTILGDGEVGLILDVGAIVRLAKKDITV